MTSTQTPIASQSLAGASVLNQTDRQYWICQLAGWSALSIFSVLSLNIWYTPGEFAPLVHSFLQSVVGLLLSHPLRYVARRAWNAKLPQRILLNALGVLAVAAIWTVLRITSFTWLTGEYILSPTGEDGSMSR